MCFGMGCKYERLLDGECGAPRPGGKFPVDGECVESDIEDELTRVKRILNCEDCYGIFGECDAHCVLEPY